MTEIAILFWMLICGLVVLLTKNLLFSIMVATILTLATCLLTYFFLLAMSIGSSYAKKLHGTDSKSDDEKRG